MAKGKNCLGLDIGSSSVKLCELRSRRDTLHLETFDYVSLAPETIVDGELMNATEVSEGIDTLLGRNNIRRKQTALSVSGNTVIIKKITLPMMTDEELEESIQWEAEQYIPFDINEVNIDHQVMNDSDVDGQMDGNLIASEQVVIRKSARVKGSIAAPRVSLEDGAQFNGSIDMDSKGDTLSKAFSGQSASRSSSAGAKTDSPNSGTGSNKPEADNSKQVSH